MVRRMYDSITAADIPHTAQMVAGYINGTFAWSASDWARFATVPRVRIATRASINDGDVLDVEPGDATPDQAPSWVVMRRKAGHPAPTIYCNAATWPAVRFAFVDARVAEPLYWIAKWDNNPVMLTGAIAKQYIDAPASGGHYDLSIVADYWPGVDKETAMPTAREIAEAVLDVDLADGGTLSDAARSINRTPRDGRRDGLQQILDRLDTIDDRLNTVDDRLATLEIGGLDYEALARAVNDDAARRMVE